jgi:aryl-alcohol dehydrogenase-like predicted oxidoreductase
MGLGCWAIGGPWRWLDGQGGWGDIDDNESIRAIHTALDLGINFFDTAANYGTGHSERVLARALAGKRDQAILATKFGFHVNEAEKQVTFRTDDHLLHVREECEASLRRLNTEAIDLYQLHVWEDPLLRLEHGFRRRCAGLCGGETLRRHST